MTGAARSVGQSDAAARERSLGRICAVALGCVLVGSLAVALCNWINEGRALVQLGATVVALAIITLVLRIAMCARASSRAFLAVAVALFLVTRLAWILVVPTRPVWDFAQFHDLATAFANGLPVASLLEHDWSISLASWGYPFALAGVYALFGASVTVGKLANLAAGALTLVLVFALVRRLASPREARVAATLFLLWPAQLVFSGVLASEHFATAALLAALVVLTPMITRSDAGRGRSAVAGLLLGVAYVVRSPLLVALPATLLALLLRGPRRRAAARVLIVVAAFCTTYGAYVATLRVLHHVTPEPQGWTQLLHGTNTASGGTFNTEDFEAMRAQGSPPRVLAFARAQALHRIASSPFGYLRLASRKTLTLWGDDDYAGYWAFMDLGPQGPSSLLFGREDEVDVVADAFHAGLLVLAVVALARLLREPRDGGVLLLLLVLLGCTALHGLLEVQPRYHYAVEPALFAIAAIGLYGSAREGQGRLG
jgi:4-amino-4-deoxy-L-arabinose transferase-like glycosyltransferase